MNNQAADALVGAIGDSATQYHEYSTFYCCGCGNRLVVPVYCGDRFCETCGVRRRSRVKRRLAYMIANTPHPPFHSMKFLTLTVKSSLDLSAQIRLIQKSFTRLRARLWWKQHVEGGAYVIEVTHGTAGWHVHIHAVIMASFMPHGALKTLWKKVSGSNIVWIKKVWGTDLAGYLTKYLTKSQTTADFRLELKDAFKGVRMFQPFGGWQMLRDRSAVATCKCNACNGTKWQLTERPTYRLIASTRTGQEAQPASAGGET